MDPLRKQDEEVRPTKLLINLKHYEQKYSWDCGVACILMILPGKKRQHFQDNFKQICNEEGFNNSTWTIDLCYLLKRYELNHAYYTTTLGIHPGYKEHAFYNSVLTEDASRVNERFRIAREYGLNVTEGSLDISHLLSHLKNGPVIVLTNARLLCCDICKLNRLSNEFRKCIPWPVSYQGHYVVLCGYDFNTGKVYYRNPAFNDRICVMSMDCFDDARKSYGTDEDAILTFNETE